MAVNVVSSSLYDPPTHKPLHALDSAIAEEDEPQVLLDLCWWGDLGQLDHVRRPPQPGQITIAHAAVEQCTHSLSATPHL